MYILFWISLFFIIYTYVGYGILLYIILKLKTIIKGKRNPVPIGYTPTLTFIVAAYNEAYCIREKIENTLSLEYPDDKIEFIFVTDGSTDDTPTIIKEYPRIRLLHKDGRSGKIAAVHRAMQEVKTDIVVFYGCKHDG